MIKIAVVLVHNLNNTQNTAVINAILSRIERITDTHTDPDTGVTFDTYHYQITALAREHEVRFFQVVPFGVTPPANLYTLDSHKVFYGAGDENKTGTHPRFFNWGLKRAIDYGADVAVYVQDASKLTMEALRDALDKLTNNVEFVEAPFGKIATRRLLRLIGQLREDRTLAQAFNEYKQRITQGGLNSG